MDLQTLRDRLATIDNPSEAAGLRAFIGLAEDLGTDVAILGKIMQSPLSLAQREAVNAAKDFSSLEAAFRVESSSEYELTIEDV